MRKLLCTLSVCLALGAFASQASADRLVQFNVTDYGTFIVQLYDATPLHQANFLAYVDAGRYNGSVIHRSDTGSRVVQGGGFWTDPNTTYLLDSIETFAPVANEAALGGSNTYMTLGAARTSDPDSATGQWFINMDDNSDWFDPGGTAGPDGYTVFGEVVSGQDIVEAIYAETAWDFGNAFTTIPLQDSYTAADYADGTLPTTDQLVVMHSVYEVTATPEPGTLAVMGVGFAGLLARRRRRKQT